MENENKSGWNTRTSLEKTLIVTCSILGALAVAFMISLIVVAVNSEDNSDPLEGICMTPACIHESSQLLSNMNLDADPCDDFYEYTCGKFMTETVIPDDKTQITSFNIIDTQMKEQLRAIVNVPIADNEIQSFQNVKRLFQACMNTDLIEQRDLFPIAFVLNSMGGWPVVAGDSWQDDTWTWEAAIADSRSNGYSVNFLFSFSVASDNRDTTKRVLRIDQPSLGLSREYLLDGLTHAFVQAYHDYQVDLAVLWGADRDQAELEMMDVLEFEFDLANISMAREDRRDAEKLYNPMTISELQTNYDFVDWLSYLNSIMPDEVELTLNDTVIVADMPFFERCASIAPEKRVLANYIKWRQAMASVSYMPLRFRERQQEYIRLTTGRETADPRWLTCVDSALSLFPHAFGALYVRKHFNEEAKANVNEMVDNIKAEFKLILDEIEWMDDETRAAAHTKADKMDAQMGYADELMDDAKIQEYYDEFDATVNATLYYESVFGWNVASTARNNRKYREPIDKDDWTSEVTPAVVNAFYSWYENTIKFPAGILQGAFFNADRPKYMNYGGIGYVIGHEITHGFDDQGSQYDSEGNLQNWWAEATRAAYLKEAQCIINQYGNYTEPLTELPLSGINTQGENIADNGGIKESYLAYVRWLADNPEPKLPGFNFTPQQLFWISAGQIWCGTLRKETMESRVRTGVHSPNQFRVIGPMSNSKEFADDFQCPQTSRMNPVSKCEVW